MEIYNLSIVMYHYVRRNGGLHAISPDCFEKQVEELGRKNEFISVGDLLDSLDNGRALPKNSCLLSFDDGLKEHYDFVFSHLKPKGIPAVFFPMTTVLDGVVADANKIQFLLAEIGVQKLAENFNDFLSGQSAADKNKFTINNKEKIDSRYKYDDVLTANFKSTMQLFPVAQRSEFLKKIFEKIFGNEEQFAKKLYLNADDIKQMSDAGMEIGGHTHTHPRLDYLPPDKVRNEINTSKNIIEKIIKKPLHIFSYPYGGYKDETIAILKELGYTIGLSTESGVNIAENLNRYALKRINANSL